MGTWTVWVDAQRPDGPSVQMVSTVSLTARASSPLLGCGDGGRGRWGRWQLGPARPGPGDLVELLGAIGLRRAGRTCGPAAGPIRDQMIAGGQPGRGGDAFQAVPLLVHDAVAGRCLVCRTQPAR